MIQLKTQHKEFIAAAQLYLSLSILFGTWVVYIPEITDKLGMNEGQLGVSLFFGAVGSLVGTLFGKQLTLKYGEGKMAFISVIALTISMVGVFLSPSFYALTTGLFLFGVSGGNYQIAVNSMVIAIEKKHNISIMSKCHGFFSLGALIASGLGTILMLAINSATNHIFISAALVIGLQLSTFWIYGTIRAIQEKETTQSSSNKMRKNGTLVVLALIGISAMVTEGAIADWSGLYLQDVIFANKSMLGLGYAGFSLSMTAGRFLGDYFSRRFGAIQIIIGGFTLSLMGFAFVFIPNPYLVITGFFIIGAGFSTIVPEVYRLSVNINNINPSSGIAFISGASYVGFLAGPVILGVLAENFGLTISFGCLFGFVLIGTLLAISIRTKPHFKLAKS